jgi:polyisoprenoid-binding protein YceI
MEVMIESLHHVIDQLAGIFLTLLGQVEIEHSGFESSMAHVALDDAQIDTGFEQMGGVAMAQGVD